MHQMGSTILVTTEEEAGEGDEARTHKDIFPPTIVARKVQPVLPQIVVRRALRLHVDEVRAARERVPGGAHAQREEAVVRYVVGELAEQRRAELIKDHQILICVLVQLPTQTDAPCCENRRSRRGCFVRSLDVRRDACVRGTALRRRRV